MITVCQTEPHEDFDNKWSRALDVFWPISAPDIAVDSVADQYEFEPDSQVAFDVSHALVEFLCYRHLYVNANRYRFGSEDLAVRTYSPLRLASTITELHVHLFKVMTKRLTSVRALSALHVQWFPQDDILVDKYGL